MFAAKLKWAYGSNTSFLFVAIGYASMSAQQGSGVANRGTGNYNISNVDPSVRSAFGSDAKVTTLTEDTTVYRYYGGSSQSSGFWYTPNIVASPASELALPPGNTGQFMDTVVLPAGTMVIEGTVAPYTLWGQPGGGYQYYVLP